MSDFHPKSFKWTQMLSIFFEYVEFNDLEDALFQLRQYAEKKYKAKNPIDTRFQEYYKDIEGTDEIYGILVQMFGEP
ncbi:hypothetical protein LCGC14_0547930 [marine sediment metagenome]|uniref:Uncharacterized protein n=1 Tax=marine sediment metagenome TaxID=412755 RepID=A0A0F9UCA8_9ZZZZ